MTDPIVDEVRKARDEYAAQFNYDLQAMVRDLREQQRKSGRTFVDYSRRADTAPASAIVPAPVQASPSPQPDTAGT
jgi:hypothetical protein